MTSRIPGSSGPTCATGEGSVKFPAMAKSGPTTGYRPFSNLAFLLFAALGLFAQNRPMSSTSTRVDVDSSKLLVTPAASDWLSYNGDYSGAPANGSAWSTGECSVRVMRGGSWRAVPRDLRSAGRSWVATGGMGADLGFRVARALTR